MKRKLFLHSFRWMISCGMILVQAGTAASIPPSETTPEWKIFTTPNSGLADHTVFNTAFAENGIHWIGTNNGLNKFDGVNWTTYQMANSGLPANIVKELMIDTDGKLWIGTDGIFTTGGGGLAIYDGSNWEIHNPTVTPGFPDIWVTAIVRDSLGRKWIGTDNGLVKYDGTTWTVLPSSYYTYYASVAALAVKDDTSVYIGTGSGLSFYNNIGFTVYHTGSSGLPADNIWALEMDWQGNLWIGTNTGGLAKFDGTNWTVYNTSNSGIPVNDVTSIAFDGNHELWIGTWQGGMVHFDGSTWTIYNTSNSQIPSDNIYSVTIDSYGNKWIGTPAGLAVFNKGGILGIESKDPSTSDASAVLLEQNHPNPFTGMTTITFILQTSGSLTLRILNMFGNEVAKPLDGWINAGRHTLTFDGSGLPAGIYCCVVTAGEGSAPVKMVKW